MKKLSVVKIGGKVLDNKEKLDSFLKDFTELEGAKILIHGGGKTATEMAKKLGVDTTMIEGRRVTNAESLEVVTMVYAGLVNKNLVVKLQALNTTSLGLTGADLNIIPAHKRKHPSIDFGYVGDFNTSDIETKYLTGLLDDGVTPVFCALTHDNKGSLLNTNADTIASGLAIAFADKYKVELIYCFEKPGVLLDANDDDSLIEELSVRKFITMKDDKLIHDGMIPKLDNAFGALSTGVNKVTIKDAMNLGNTIGTSLSL